MEQSSFDEFRNDKRLEYHHLKNDILINKNSENKNIHWFLSYKPINIINNSRDSTKIIKKINSDYIKYLYIDNYYKFKSNATYISKFPKFYIKFENGYKRFGCISFYGVRNSVFQDYYFYSNNAKDFILNKIMFKEAFSYNKKNNHLKNIKLSNNNIIDIKDIDDIYIIALSGDNHTYLENLREIQSEFFDFSDVIYDGILPTNLDIYKNNKLVKSINIKDNHYKINDHFVEIYNEHKELIEKYNILNI